VAKTISRTFAEAGLHKGCYPGRFRFGFLNKNYFCAKIKNLPGFSITKFDTV